MLNRFVFCWLLLGALAGGQTPSPDPEKKNVPAEIVPPKGAETPGTAKETAPASLPLSPGTKAAVEGAASPTQKSLEQFSEAELDEVITLIRQRYVTSSALSELALKRATVQGLLDRLGASASISTAPAPPASAPSPFRSEILNERIGYLRLGAFDAATADAVDKALAGLAQKKIKAFIVDLRATPAGSDFARASEICGRFCPKGEILFTLRRADNKQPEVFTAKDEPRAQGMLAVLTNAATAGSAEVVAGTLRASAKAIVIGQKTKGMAAEFADLPLQNGRTLRLAVGEVLLPGDVSLVPDGVKPDVQVEVSPETETTLLAQELDKGAAPLVLEAERNRLNEAALVAGTNPELDNLQAAQGARSAKGKLPLRDVILQRAVDLITTVEVFEKEGANRKK